MNTIETTAGTLEEAVALAAERLGVAPNDLDVTKLEEGKGLFGKGKIRIRATVKAVAAPPSSKPKAVETAVVQPIRSEERRVGKECRL